MRSISALTTSRGNFDAHVLARLVDVDEFGFHAGWLIGCVSCQLPAIGLRAKGAKGGTRTPMAVNHRILSPARLPVPPLSRNRSVEPGWSIRIRLARETSKGAHIALPPPDRILASAPLMTTLFPIRLIAPISITGSPSGAPLTTAGRHVSRHASGPATIPVSDHGPPAARRDARRRGAGDLSLVRRSTGAAASSRSSAICAWRTPVPQCRQLVWLAGA